MGASGSSALSPARRFWGVLVLGVTITGLLFGLVIVLTQSRRRALLLVERRTGELRPPALHDGLTGLPNRALVLDRIEQALARARRHPRALAVLHLDLDGFKAVKVLSSHPAVADVAVVGVPDDDLGEAARAVVRVADDVPAGSALSDELIALCRTTLAGFKRPRGVDFVDQLPRTPTGKLLKDEVRRPYWTVAESGRGMR